MRHALVVLAIASASLTPSCGSDSDSSNSSGGACSGDSCQGDPCHGVTCATPDAPACIDGATRRTFDAAGTCLDGTCSYAATDTTCLGACVSGACTANDCGSGWCPLPDLPGAPSARLSHTAVWTGAEMIVWGGLGVTDLPDAGGRLDPAINVWSPLPALPGAPSPRSDHSAVWTGSEMIVWGGASHGMLLDDGGRFDPATNGWSALSAGAGAPAARSQHSAVWTGTEMIVWGGEGDQGVLGDGARFDPATNGWSPISGSGAPTPRYDHSAIWTGKEMIVWGGHDATVGYASLDDGGRYDPATDSWSPLPAALGTPSGRSEHTAVWSGTEMIVWGGVCGETSLVFCNDGGRFDPATGDWGPLAPSATLHERVDHSAVWTGIEMLAWGGRGYSSWYTDGARWMP